jgi:hypothetical protein
VLSTRLAQSGRHEKESTVLTLKRFGVTTVLVASIAMPATSAAQGQDLRNADRRSPAPASAQDLRNADRRSPASVDPAPAEASVVTAIEVPSDGFDWADAGIGAAGGIAILVILAGMAMAVTHRRHGPRVTA